MDAKIQKLEQQYATTAAHNPYKKSDLFAGISIFVNGLTTPSADELKRIMMTHGGVYHAYYRSGATTFIIAEQLPDVKIRAMRASRTIIRADWVVECVRQMRIVDYARYLLYTDSTRADQPKLCFATASKAANATSLAKVPKTPEKIAAAIPKSSSASTINQSSHQPVATVVYIDDDDDDMFADDGLADDMSPMVDLKQSVPDAPKTDSLNNSFVANLNVINVKMRKHLSDAKLEPPLHKTPDVTCESTMPEVSVKLQRHPHPLDKTPDVICESTMPEVSVKLQRHPSYAQYSQPHENASNSPIPTTDTVEPAAEVPTLPQTLAEKPPDVAHQKPTINKATATAVRTAVDPNFLAEFYSNSRLHHIATLGANFKNYICQLRDSSDLLHFPARQTITVPARPGQMPSPVQSTIMHIDMDCFFVSVGLRTRPALRGQPVAVTHSKGGGQSSVRLGADPERERAMWAQRHHSSANGTTENRVDTKTSALPLAAGDSLAEIASCSYEARARGLKNGMFVGAALKLCPTLCTIPYDFEAYKEVAQQLYDTVAK